MLANERKSRYKLIGKDTFTNWPALSFLCFISFRRGCARLEDTAQNSNEALHFVLVLVSEEHFISVQVDVSSHEKTLCAPTDLLYKRTSLLNPFSGSISFKTPSNCD